MTVRLTRAQIYVFMFGLFLLSALVPTGAQGADVGQMDVAASEQLEPASAFYSIAVDGYAAFTFEAGIRETTLLLDSTSETWRVDKLLTPRKSQQFPSFGFSVDGTWEPSSSLSLNLLFYTGELRDGRTLPLAINALTSNGVPVGDAAKNGSFLCELAAEVYGQGVSTRFGRFRTSTASGLVYDDYGTGANIRVDFDQFELGPWSTQLDAVIVGRRFDEMRLPSPLLSWRLDWNLSWFESMGLFAAVYFDRNGDAAEVVRNALAERAAAAVNTPFLSQLALDGIYSAKAGYGRMGFIGITTQLYPIKSLSVRATALWSPGTFTIPVAEEVRRTVALSSYAGELETRYGLNEAWEIGLIGFALSGDHPPQADNSTYHAFIGVAPYWVWSGLFFSGGLNQGLQPRRASSAGINGHGVVGAGPVATLIATRYQAELRAVWLQALVEPPSFLATQGNGYGVEVNGTFSLELLSWLLLSVESDLLFPGSYLPGSRPAYRVLSLLRGSYGS